MTDDEIMNLQRRAGMQPETGSKQSDQIAYALMHLINAIRDGKLNGQSPERVPEYKQSLDVLKQFGWHTGSTPKTAYVDPVEKHATSYWDKAARRK